MPSTSGTIDVVAWRAARPAARRSLHIRVPFLRHRLAARAVRELMPLGSLGAVHVAELVVRGSTLIEGSRIVAIQDEDSVVLSTTPGPGPGPTLPLSAVINIGNSGGW